jgi:hypothetical protein
MTNEKSLGTIQSEIVGFQYYDDEVKTSEKIILEREPDNDHDPNAMLNIPR